MFVLPWTLHSLSDFRAIISNHTMTHMHSIPPNRKHMERYTDWFSERVSVAVHSPYWFVTCYIWSSQFVATRFPSSFFLILPALIFRTAIQSASSEAYHFRHYYQRVSTFCGVFFKAETAHGGSLSFHWMTCPPQVFSPLCLLAWQATQPLQQLVSNFSHSSASCWK